MSLIKKNGQHQPSRSLYTGLFDADKFFPSDFFNFPILLPAEVPPANIKDEEKQFHLEMSAPGFDKKDFKINVENNILTISAEKKEEKKDDSAKYTRKEFNYSSFERSFALPNAVMDEGIKAEYKEGILRLSIPKKATSENKKKVISVL